MNLRAVTAAEWLAPGSLPESVETIKAFSQQRKEQFLAPFNNGEKKVIVTPAQAQEWLAWIKSDIGQAWQQQFNRDLQELFAQMQRTGLTSHDVRHMLLVTWQILTNLKQNSWENDWRSGAIIGGLAHDWGRVIEAKMEAEYRVTKQPKDWDDSIHAQLSMMVLEKLWESYPTTPSWWRDLILFAVVEHTGRPGAYDSPGEISALVQTGDRHELIDSEGFYRHLQEEVNARGTRLDLVKTGRWNWQLPPLTDREQSSFATSLEYFLRRVDLSIGRDKMAAEQAAKSRLARVLYWSLPEWGRAQIFAPEIEFYDQQQGATKQYPADAKPIMSAMVWQAARAPITTAEQTWLDENQAKTTAELVAQLWQAPGSANSKVELNQLQRRIEVELTGKLEAGFRRGVILALKDRYWAMVGRQELIQKWSTEQKTSPLVELAIGLIKDYLE